MKKNMLTIIILALTLVNMVLTAVIVFTVVPTSSRTNKLISQVASVVQLDIGQNDSDALQEKVDVSNLEPYLIEEAMNLNLKKGTDEKDHYARLDSVSLSLNNKAKGYKKTKEALEKNESLVTDIVTEVISGYTLDNAPDSRDEIKKKILDKLQERFDSTAIYDISLKNLIFV